MMAMGIFSLVGVVFKLITMWFKFWWFSTKIVLNIALFLLKGLKLFRIF